MKKTPLSVEEIKKLRKPVLNVNTSHRNALSSLDLFAIWVTQKIGSVGFFFLIFFWTLIWLGWNTLGPAEYQFETDPF